MKTFKVMSALLAYPEQPLLDHLDDCAALLQREALLSKKSLLAVEGFIDYLRDSDLLTTQENYVATFDRGRGQSLHLFEHIFGESRDRGQAMVNLNEAYAEKGLYIDRAELPDYLPLFLEYLSLCDAREAVELLGEPVDVIATIGARLKRKQSPYRALFDALVALSKAKPDSDKIRQALAGERDDDSFEAIDREWEEAAAFGGDDAACNGCAAGQSSAPQVAPINYVAMN